MGKCQSLPIDKQPQLTFNSPSKIKHPLIKKPKNNPSQQFAQPIEQRPKLTRQVQERIVKLGPFRYQNCGEQKNSTQLGPYKLKNGCIYVGEWLDGRTHGKGKYYLPDESFFQGISVQNQIQGYGRIIHSNGDYFQGQLKGGKANGQGVYVQGAVTYEGVFRDNLQHGQGVQYNSFYEFKGFFVGGQKLKGVLTFKDNKKYEYNGQFKNNRYHGCGVLRNDIGKYEGQFFNGLKNGYGRFTWADGQYYYGQYRNDFECGQGKLYDKDRKLIRGEFGNKTKQATENQFFQLQILCITQTSSLIYRSKSSYQTNLLKQRWHSQGQKERKRIGYKITRFSLLQIGSVINKLLLISSL